MRLTKSPTGIRDLNSFGYHKIWKLAVWVSVTWRKTCCNVNKMNTDSNCLALHTNLNVFHTIYLSLDVGWTWWGADKTSSLCFIQIVMWNSKSITKIKRCISLWHRVLTNLFWSHSQIKWNFQAVRQNSHLHVVPSVFEEAWCD